MTKQQNRPSEAEEISPVPLRWLAIAAGAAGLIGNAGLVALVSNGAWAAPADAKKGFEGGKPFTVGQVNPSKGFVHVFDDATLPLVLQQLDTVSDFVYYL